MRLRALSTIAEDQGGDGSYSRDQDGNLNGVLSPEMHPHPLEPHLLPSKPHPFPSMDDPFEQEDDIAAVAETTSDVNGQEKEDLSPSPQGNSTLKSTPNQSIEAPASARGGSEIGSSGGSGGMKHDERKEEGANAVTRQLSRPHRSKKSSAPGATAILSQSSEEADSETTSPNNKDSNSNAISDSSSTQDDGIQSASREDESQNSSSSAPSLTSTSRHHKHHSPNSDTLESSMDTGVRLLSPRPRRASDTSEGNSGQTHSSGAGSPIARCKTPQTPVHRPSAEFVVLQPLSPEHGLELNEQYEFLRRTLSHSQRRFSQRGRKPRERRGHHSQRGGEGSNRLVVQRGKTESGLMKSQVSPRLLRAQTSKEVRQKQTIGQLKSILLESENQPPQQENRNEDLEEHIDQHGRTYYMDHVTRTIAFDRLGDVEDVDVPPQQQDMQTRREMLDRRWALIG